MATIPAKLSWEVPATPDLPALSAGVLDEAGAVAEAFSEAPTAGVAGFSRGKTLEMMEFNRWRSNTPDGRAWDERQRQQQPYRHPGDPRQHYQDRFIYEGPGIER